jgi:hypothetical protein
MIGTWPCQILWVKKPTRTIKFFKKKKKKKTGLALEEYPASQKKAGVVFLDSRSCLSLHDE